MAAPSRAWNCSMSALEHGGGSGLSKTAAKDALAMTSAGDSMAARSIDSCSVGRASRELAVVLSRPSLFDFFFGRELQHSASPVLADSGWLDSRAYSVDKRLLSTWPVRPALSSPDAALTATARGRTGHGTEVYRLAHGFARQSDGGENMEFLLSLSCPS